ncbi:hypothetical protein BH20ACI4_BH20ACI4_20460 [soil metagenome]
MIIVIIVNENFVSKYSYKSGENPVRFFFVKSFLKFRSRITQGLECNFTIRAIEKISLRSE